MRAIACLFLLVCPVLTATTAAARPRDDVMAGAYRCAGIASTRVWLDCYYGAAQPQRAELGLASAPPTQVQLSRSAPLGGAGQDLNVRDQVMASAARCAAESDGRQWLNCYYAAAVPVRALLGLSVPVGTVIQAPPAEPVPVPRQQAVGHRRPSTLETLLGAKDVFIESRMVSYSFDLHDNFIVTLDNGQVWRQADSDSIAHWRKHASAYLVDITGGAFGSYNLSIKGITGKFKVRRVP